MEGWQFFQIRVYLPTRTAMENCLALVLLCFSQCNKVMSRALSFRTADLSAKWNCKLQKRENVHIQTPPLLLLLAKSSFSSFGYQNWTVQTHYMKEFCRYYLTYCYVSIEFLFPSMLPFLSLQMWNSSILQQVSTVVTLILFSDSEWDF